jgi:hypothetical protein
MGREAFPSGMPAVLILHAADPRHLQCPDESAAECVKAPAIDRVAWAAGRDVDIELPDDRYALVPG